MPASRPLLLALCVGGLIGCGKRGDPQPPLRVVPQPVAQLRLAQRGDKLELSGVAPTATTSGARLPVLDVELWRAQGPGDFERLATRSVRKLAPGEAFQDVEPLPPPGTSVRVAALARVKGRSSSRSSVLTLTTWEPLHPPSALEAALTTEGVSLTWTPASVQPSPPPTPAPSPSPRGPTTPRHGPGRPGEPQPSATGAPPTEPAAPAPGAALPSPGAAATSSPEPAVPGAPTALPPASPAPIAQATPEAGPTPAVTAPGAATSPASPAPAASPSPAPTPPPRGFWVYRRAKDGVYAAPVASALTPAPSYVDGSAPLGQEWCYVVRYVAQLSPPVESAPSNEVCLDVRDVTPPAAPTGLAMVQSPDAVELSWIAGTDADLAGYRVYRAVEPAEESEATLLAELPKDATVFRDTDLKPGLVHAYYVVAVDAAGNESPHSETLRVRP